MNTYADIRFKKDKLTFLREKLGTDRMWAIRGLLRIYSFQTDAEQAVGATTDANGVGFSGADAEILSSFAEQVQNSRSLSEKQMNLLFKRMPRYARQLMEYADAV